MTTSYIEQHPHIVFNLRISWGFKRCRDYLAEMLLVEQGNTRQGFPYQTFEEIQFLLELHDLVFPQFKPKPVDDPWGTRYGQQNNIDYGLIEYK